MDALEPRSLSDSEFVRIRLRAGLGAVMMIAEFVDPLVSDIAPLVHPWLARIVPPFASHASSSSSSSARSAKTSGSSSSGGNVDTQHIRAGSKIMLPTLRAPAAKEPTGDPMDDPVRCVINAGRVEVPTTVSNSRSTWSFPSQRRVVGFHFISPTTFGPLALPRWRIKVGFLLVWPSTGEEASFFFFTEISVPEAFGNSMRPVRLKVLVAGASAPEISGLATSFLPFLRIVPASLSFSLSEDFDKLTTGLRFVALGCTLNLPSLSRSVGRSSKASNSVPSPYVRCRFGRRRSLGADAEGMSGICVCATRLRSDIVEGGRGSGDVARCEG